MMHGRCAARTGRFGHCAGKSNKSSSCSSRLTNTTRSNCIYLHRHLSKERLQSLSIGTTMKTVVLCRHAESKENVKIRAFKDGVARLKNWSLPTMRQVSKSLSLLKYNTDQAVSPAGQEQIQMMANAIKSSNFLEKFQPELVCHSPLQRAKDTSRGIFGQKETDIELASLTEMTPVEIFWFNDRSTRERIHDFETWLDSRHEERIIIVGHSRYFKLMLNADEVIGNCSIIKCTFNPPLSLPSSKEVNSEVNSRWHVDEVLYSLEGVLLLARDKEEKPPAPSLT